MFAVHSGVLFQLRRSCWVAMSVSGASDYLQTESNNMEV